MRREGQIEKIATILESSTLDYWIDAGSLLGLVREGQLLPWDNDIDIGCWQHNRLALDEVAVRLEEHGYRRSARHYRGSLYQLKLKPSWRSGLRAVDFTIYTHQGGTAWCPINCVEPPPAPRGSLRWFLQKPVRDLFIKPWVRDQQRRRRDVPRPRIRLEVRTWVVPANYFRDLTDLTVGDGTTVRVPRDTDGYLTLRYGDWRQPVADWDYTRDDGALDPRPPEEVAASL